MADTTVKSASPTAAAVELRQVSRSVPRLESRAKATGTAEYIYNLRIPGMLWGKIFRSTMPHARILSIDVSAALALEGVEAVLTGEDMRAAVHDPYYGPAFHDQPVLALDKVRYVGEPVAVVFACDPNIAEEAADLIAELPHRNEVLGKYGGVVQGLGARRDADNARRRGVDRRIRVGRDGDRSTGERWAR